MQAIMETLFDIFYLTSVITLGILMASRKQAQKQYRLFGIMAILLGFGDAFHLIPRAFALILGDLPKHPFHHHGDSHHHSVLSKRPSAP